MRINLPIRDSELRHIFRKEEGHLPDTPENRALILEVANDLDSRLEFDQYGNHWAARVLESGEQLWVRMREGKVINAGVNVVHREFNSLTGLNRP